ncbi:MAG: hypothetical protein OEX12_07025 [Gammaproteobacteria bacterium]|nr:hypothetical protein [Gammaproteobacteria bacterium]
MSADKTEELEKRIAEIETKLAIQEGIEKGIANEKTSLFKSLLLIVKVVTALIVLYSVGEQAMEYHWIKEIIK